jgi:hypothetical protein
MMGGVQGGSSVHPHGNEVRINTTTVVESSYNEVQPVLRAKHSVATSVCL